MIPESEEKTIVLDPPQSVEVQNEPAFVLPNDDDLFPELQNKEEEKKSQSSQEVQPKKKDGIKQKFKMVNTLRLGLSKFDEVIKPESVKIKKAFEVDKQSQASGNKSRSGSIPEDKKTVRVFKNDLGSYVEGNEQPCEKPKLVSKIDENASL